MDPSTPLHAVRTHILERREDGTICPACHQHVKLYKRKLNSGMARALIDIAHYFRNPEHAEWLHVLNYLVARNAFNADWPKLRHWGLLSCLETLRDDGSDRVGLYRLTDIGEEFVQGRCTVPKYVYLFNDTVEGFSDGENIDIHQALGSHFNYRELMGRL
jgi:hypothetical protein